MNANNTLTHRDRLEIIFKLKVGVLEEIILGKYMVDSKDIINLVSDLTEIVEKLKSKQEVNQTTLVEEKILIPFPL